MNLLKSQGIADKYGIDSRVLEALEDQGALESFSNRDGDRLWQESDIQRVLGVEDQGTLDDTGSIRIVNPGATLLSLRPTDCPSDIGDKPSPSHPNCQECKISDPCSDATCEIAQKESRCCMPLK